MAHNALVRASLAAWGAALTVTPAEMWAIDQAQYASVNGDAGGTWAPAALIIIGGSGMQITGPLSASNAQDFTWAATKKAYFTDHASASTAIELDTNRSLDVLADAHINVRENASIELLGDFNVGSTGSIIMVSGGALVAATGSSIAANNGSTVTLAGAVSLSATGALTTIAGSTIVAGGTVELNGAVTVNGDATFVGEITTQDNVNQQSKLIKTGSGGRTAWRVTTLTSDVDNTVTVNNDIYFYSTSVTGRTLSLRYASSPVPMTGERITIHISNTSGGLVTVKNEGSAAKICYVSGSAIIDVVFDGAKWRLSGASYDTNFAGVQFEADS